MASLSPIPTTSFNNTRQQLHGAAQGLKYIHDAGFAHGDLKGVGVFSFCYRFRF